MYSFVPFGLLLIVNTLLVKVLHEKIRHLSGSISIAKQNQIAISGTVLAITLLFILFTSPSAICSHFYDKLITTHTGKIILFVAGCFAFSYHALNIVILCVSNKHFFRCLKNMLLCQKLKQNDSSVVVNRFFVNAITVNQTGPSLTSNP